MANEAQVTCGLFINKDNVQYQSRPLTFTADIGADPAKGPTPGALTVTTTGTDVSLAQLSTPGLCWLQNLDADANDDGLPWVEYGIWDTETGVFYPLGELLPGEFAVIRLSRFLGIQYDDTGTGTGTTGASNRLRLKSHGGSAVVRVDAFDR